MSRALPPTAFLLAPLLVAASFLAAHPADAQSLRGSPASINRMYRGARLEQLPFHQTGRDVHAAVARGRLVRLQAGAHVALHDVAFPVVAPATRTFVTRLGGQYRAACGERLVVTSATRPATRQPANSVARSVHPTGMAVDLRKPAGRCLRWLRATLRELEGAGLLEATEEHAPAHFHVAVYPMRYTLYVASRAAPSPRASQVATSPPGTPEAGAVYQVRAGDTLWDIARDHRTTVAALLGANGLDDAALKPGQTLVLPVDERIAEPR